MMLLRPSFWLQVTLKGIVFRKRAFGSSGSGWWLASPLSKPLFSERHGYRKPTIKLGGFRLIRLEAGK